MFYNFKYFFKKNKNKTVSCSEKVTEKVIEKEAHNLFLSQTHYFAFFSFKFKT